VVLGRRDVESDDEGPVPSPPPGVLDLPLDAVRARGMAAVAGEALSRLVRPGLDGFWIHLDADVLDDALVPAVDYRMPGGLAPEELAVALRAALATGRALGLHLTILNPRLDPAGEAVRTVAAAIARGLGR
jgi:arginase